MGNLTIATTFIILLNVLMWFVSIAALSVNPNGTVCYNLEGSVIDNTVTSTGTIPDSTIINNNILDDLPSSEGTTISPSSTSVTFTDIFNNILGWFKSAPGIKYIYAVIAAPYNILKCMNLPNLFIAGIGTLWYVVSLLVFLAFMWGRD